MQEPLRLYVNKEFVAPHISYVPLLYPFWGPYKKETIPFVMSALLAHSYDPTCFTLVERPEDAEYILMPHDYWLFRERSPMLFSKCLEYSSRYNKPLLIDASGDRAGTVSVPNARVLRIHQYKFEAPLYEVKVPVPCEDLLEVYAQNTLALREKKEKPRVGFVGWSRMSVRQSARSFLKEVPLRVWALFDRRQKAKIKGVFWRQRANQIFKSSTEVESVFIERSSYSGHIATAHGDMKTLRQEFVDNIKDSDYSLVIRGDANEATRFYEVLSLGRIPVLIDTAVVLPLEHLVDYREFCVIIDHTDLERAPAIVAEFHKHVSPERFISMQKRAREVFETYLRYDSFSPYLVTELRKTI